MALLVDVVIFGDVTHGLGTVAVFREWKDEVGGEESLRAGGERGSTSERQAREKARTIFRMKN